MADKEAKKADAPAAPAKAPAADEKKGDKAGGGGGSGGLMSKTPVLLGGVMLLEAVVLFAGFKFLMGGPKQADAGVGVTTTEGADDKSAGEHGEAGHGGEGKGEGKKVNPSAQVEVPVVEFRAPNKQSGRTFIYDVSIFAVTKKDNSEKVKGMIESRGNLIKDRVRTIIAQSDPEKLEGGSEPNLDTLRRQVKVQLDEVIGEGLVEEVLVPRCIPYRLDY